MSDKAERLHSAIKEHGGYDEISHITGISVSTLVRIAKGKTEPKLRDVVAISEATNTSLNYIVYGKKETSLLDDGADELVKAMTKISEKIFKERIENLKSEDKEKS
jgi:transcriptional regulator with XRE-family HTH domain